MPLNSIVLYRVFEKTRSSVSESVRTLLEHKHLYQSVEADISVDREEVRKSVDPDTLYTNKDFIADLDRSLHDKHVDNAVDSTRKILEEVPWRFWVDQPDPGDINDSSL